MSDNADRLLDIIEDMGVLIGEMNTTRLLDIIEDMGVLIGEMKDMLQDLYYLYADIVKNEK